MATSHNETNHSENNTSSEQTAIHTKKIAEPIYTYAVEWKWLIIGLLIMVTSVGIVGAAYYYKTTRLSNDILDVVKRQIEESDKIKAKAEGTSNLEEKRELLNRSVKIRSDAAKLLDNYKRANPNLPDTRILREMYDILESLYKDYGEGTTPHGIQLGEQLTELALELTRFVPDDMSIKYRIRLLELAWDRRVFSEIAVERLSSISGGIAYRLSLT